MARLLILSVLFVGLMVTPASAQDISDHLLRSFNRLEGKVSVLVLETDVAISALVPSADAGDTVPAKTDVQETVIAQLNADASLAVASAFKLSVLATLQAQINAGIHTWDEVIDLLPQAKSLPSGILQAWPDKTPITLQTLATLMISISDNTAADALIQLLGPTALKHNKEPLLTTRQVFTLKNPDNQTLLETYRQSADRIALLPEIDQASLPKVELVDTVPLAQDIEWFFSTRELCGYMEEVADLPLMQINTGIIDPAPWQQVAFKGGSEPGVLNLTAALTSTTGHQYCVSATWNNDQPLAEYQFFQAYSDLIETLSSAE
ncbi:MAG: serine hydrolase [Cyanobacteria bacterium P01_A01_bin.17]